MARISSVISASYFQIRDGSMLGFPGPVPWAVPEDWNLDCCCRWHQSWSQIRFRTKATSFGLVECCCCCCCLCCWEGWCLTLRTGRFHLDSKDVRSWWVTSVSDTEPYLQMDMNIQRDVKWEKKIPNIEEIIQTVNTCFRWQLDRRSWEIAGQPCWGVRPDPRTRYDQRRRKRRSHRLRFPGTPLKKAWNKNEAFSRKCEKTPASYRLYVSVFLSGSLPRVPESELEKDKLAALDLGGPVHGGHS